jgi:hypothetical protein
MFVMRPVIALRNAIFLLFFVLFLCGTFDLDSISDVVPYDLTCRFFQINSLTQRALDQQFPWEKANTATFREEVVMSETVEKGRDTVIHKKVAQVEATVAPTLTVFDSTSVGDIRQHIPIGDIITDPTLEDLADVEIQDSEHERLNSGPENEFEKMSSGDLYLHH